MSPLFTRTALVMALGVPLAAAAQISVSINIAPPALLEYAQPAAPADGYIWTPGYWAWNPDPGDYYWVPGTWVLAPSVGDLWTPGYWDSGASGYYWHVGYWGPTVGYYGGLNYGHGYTGSGYQGGRWDHGSFRYNRQASNVNPAQVHNIYSAAVVNAARAGSSSYHGGQGGSHVEPTAPQRAWQVAAHPGPTGEQIGHERTALAAPEQRASISHGAPPVAATPRPSAFSAAEVERTRPAPAFNARPASPPQRAAPPRPQSQPRAEPRAEPSRPPNEPRAEPARAPNEPRAGEPRRNEEPRR